MALEIHLGIIGLEKQGIKIWRITYASFNRLRKLDTNSIQYKSMIRGVISLAALFQF